MMSLTEESEAISNIFAEPKPSLRSCGTQVVLRGIVFQTTAGKCTSRAAWSAMAKLQCKQHVGLEK